MERIEKNMLLAVPIMFLLGALFHFVFEWTGNFSLIAPFFPVNESIWEHTKLAVFPLVLFYLIYYFLYKSKHNIDREKWFTSLIVSIMVSIVAMIVLYYTYSGIIGKDYTIIDISLLPISLIIGQIAALKNYNADKNLTLKNCIIALIVIFAFYIYLTFKPLHIDLFYDFATNKYSY